MKLDVAVLSRVGGRSRNEDACGHWSSDDAACFVVSDGAGGHGGGDVAARAVVAAIVHGFAAAPQVSAPAIADLIRSANAAVRAQQKAEVRLQDMRATVAVLAIDCRREFALWGHVGDTRVYGLRDHRIRFQSHDHSVLQRMIDAGYGDASLLRSHPRRGVLLHALGGDEPVPPTPIADELQFLRDDDAFLLCTDGLWEHVAEARMVQELGAARDAAGWLAALEAEVGQNAQAGNDNYSAIAVRVAEVGDATRFDPL